MRLKMILLGFSLSLFSAIVMAGAGHDHGHSHSHAPVNQETAKTNATKIVATLVKKEKLAKSWASVTASSAETKVVKDNSEWVVIFLNDKIADSAKQKLYIFLTMDGEYIAANHTGK